ncbi:MAG: UDP-glucose 4-epimerase GalE [Deltaproteobacteria bacterium]|nr:UDP-glucose 4-epimerase GalE [Deltaproteobacteria bacterium]
MIFVTGGAGYIGSHAAKELARGGYSPLVLDNLSCGHRELAKWSAFIEGDLSDKTFLRNVFTTYPIQAVMHFAGFAYVGESVNDPAKYYRNNVANTLNLLEAMREAGVDKMIFSSTCATYGIPQTIPISEDHPQLPINPYGRSKLMVETMLRDFCHAYQMKYVALRYFNAAGADPAGEIGEWHNPETHLIPLALDAAVGKRKILNIFGTDYDTPDGTCIRDYIHVSDLADAHVLALEYLKSGGESINLNLGNGQGFSVHDVVKMVEKVTGKIVPIQAVLRRLGDPPVLVGSSSMAKQILGWRPVHDSLEDIITTAWNWHSKLQRTEGLLA